MANTEHRPGRCGSWLELEVGALVATETNKRMLRLGLEPGRSIGRGRGRGKLGLGIGIAGSSHRPRENGKSEGRGETWVAARAVCASFGSLSHLADRTDAGGWACKPIALLSA